ncbi:hypothetical protein Tco_0795712 [Tanacetum coccineum]
MCRFRYHDHRCLIRLDFASWQQRIRLYCRGKDNGINILKSIDEGPFQMGTTREIIDEGTEGPINLGPERPRVYSELSQEEKDRNMRHMPTVNKMMLERSHTTAVDPLALRLCATDGNGFGHIARNCTQPKRPQNSEYFKDKMLLMQAQENGVTLDEEQSLFLAGGLDNAIDEDVDEQPVQDLALIVAHDHYQDAVCDHHEEHEMHDDVRPNHVVDSHADYTSDSNMTSYDQYVKDNAVPVVQNNASMVPNDAYVMIDNDLHDSDVRSVSHTPRNTVANNLLNAELATYKEQVELYERRARFELTEREQKIDEQLRIVICDRNIKEENLNKELHSIKLQLASTIQHNKLMVDEVTSLKKDFNQKENKFLEEFLDLKALKIKVGIAIQKGLSLFKQFPHDVQAQPVLYSGHVIVTPNHAPGRNWFESYQTQLNGPNLVGATGFEFKHDYTVIDSPRAVTFRDRYGVQMIMRFNEIHKFSDGTLQQIDEALDYRVKEFQINRTNPGMNTRFWSKKDGGQEQGLHFLGFNLLVHSFRALSTLRRSGLRTASAAAKPCQGDSSEVYLITGRIPTVAAAGKRHVNSQPHAHTSYF